LLKGAVGKVFFSSFNIKTRWYMTIRAKFFFAQMFFDKPRTMTFGDEK